MYNKWIVLIEHILIIVIIYLQKIWLISRGDRCEINWLIIIVLFIIIFIKFYKYFLRKKSLLAIQLFRYFFYTGAVIFFLIEAIIFSGFINSNKIQNIKVDYIIVLGNKLNEGKMTKTLKNRLDKGIELYRIIKVPIIVTGGNRIKGAAQEAGVMKEYLVNNGINENSVIVENKALDTRQNFLYVQKLIEKEKKVVIITSEVHMYRAALLAELNGYSQIITVVSASETEMLLYYNLREVIALIRELVLLNI